MRVATLTPADLEHFDRYGYVYVRQAFAPEDAARMRAVIWAALAERGIRQDDPSTWTSEFPDHLQHLKAEPAFRAIGTERTLGAIADLLGAEHGVAPKDWGGFFLLFPDLRRRPWHVPWKAWHVDHAWHEPIAPLRELKVHSMLGEIVPRAGGMTIVSGAHHVVAQLVGELGLAASAPAARVRNAVMRAHPYLRDLSTPEDGDPGTRAARIERFVDREEDVLGHPLRVVELTADPGDVILMHPLTLHTRPVNAGSAPRLLLNKDIYA